MKKRKQLFSPNDQTIRIHSPNISTLFQRASQIKGIYLLSSLYIYHFNNVVYNHPGVYNDTLVSALRCDSVLILNIGNQIGGSSVLMAVICEGDSFVFRNTYYTQSGIFADTIPTSGCDSVAILNLTVDSLPVVLTAVSNDTILSGSSVQLVCSNTQVISYSWTGNAVFSNTGASSTNATMIVSGWIYLSIGCTNGCTAFDSIYIFVTKDDGDTCD